VTYDYVHSQFRRVRLLFNRSDSYYSHQLQIYWFMRWVALRSVRITSLCVTSTFATKKLLDYLRVNGAHVTRVCFEESSSYGRIAGCLKNAPKGICAHCPNVTEIAVPFGFSPADCEAYIQAWPGLQEISIRDNIEVLNCIASGFRHLRAVTVVNCNRQEAGSDRWISFFKNVNTNLLDVESFTPISVAALSIMAARCPQLRTLSGSFPELTGDLLLVIAEGCPELTVVNIPKSREVTKRGLTSLLQACKCLTELSTPIWLGDAIKLSTSLHALHMVNADNAPSEILSTLGAHCPQLRQLTLTSLAASREHCDREILQQFTQGCPHLSYLRISLRPTDALFTLLGKYCHALSFLSLQPYTTHAVTDEGVCALAQGCPNLHTLRCTLAHPVTIVGITVLATHCRHLSQLTVSKTVNIDAQVISHLKVLVSGLY
jgi:hypothetical protein